MHVLVTWWGGDDKKCTLELYRYYVLQVGAPINKDPFLARARTSTSTDFVTLNEYHSGGWNPIPVAQAVLGNYNWECVHSLISQTSRMTKLLLEWARHPVHHACC